MNNSVIKKFITLFILILTNICGKTAIANTDKKKQV